ncbi:hypothetical protein AB0I81_06400 [Nonomuraea sp. NPDC050404]|uniref:hypothetical protein n=1 Tax=Nonomuraea sp. NPDC050404 TaxID=3155783 RepID=UPI00340E0B41
MPKPEHPHDADVQISASVTARELRFRERPEVTVHAEAEPGGECVSGSARTNLPDQVVAGVTYRDIRIDFRVAAKLADPTQPKEPADSAGPDEPLP